MAAAGGNGPQAPHMRPCAPRHCFEWMDDTPPSLRMYFGGWLKVYMALKMLLCSGDDESPHHRSVLSQQPQNYTRLLEGLLPIHSTCWHGAQSLMCGTRWAFLLAAAIVGYGYVGRCWPLEAYVRLTFCRNSKNCLRKYFFIPT
jgi:hypothetical protein